MTFEEVLAHVIEVLQREGRISYRALQRRFDLDDAYLDDLKVELFEAKQLAHDENGRILVWADQTATTASSPTAQEVPPGSLPEVQTPQEASTHVAPDVPEAERRQLTVLCGAQRRGGDWQVPPGPRAHRAGGGGAHPTANVTLLAVSHQ